MKVFTATGSGNRQLVADPGRAMDGELVRLDIGPPCVECGCAWSVVGLASGGSAPEFTVENRPDLNSGEYKRLFCDSWLRNGWRLSAANRVSIESFAKAQLDVAERFEIGELLSFRGGRLHRELGMA